MEKETVRHRGIRLHKQVQNSRTSLGYSQEALMEAGWFWLEHGMTIIRALKETHEDATRKRRGSGLKKHLEMDLDRIAERLENENLV